MILISSLSKVTEILLEDLRNVQSMMLSHENTIDSLRDEISAVDELGLEAEANLTRKENEKVQSIIIIIID